jgi:hypothetical protein
MTMNATTETHIAYVAYGAGHPRGLVGQAYGVVTNEDAETITLHSDYYGNIVDRTWSKKDILKRVDGGRIDSDELVKIAESWGRKSREAV